MPSSTPMLPFSDAVSADTPSATGVAPRRLIVLVPAIHSRIGKWTSLQKQLEKEVGYQPTEAEWFPFDHGTRVWTPGHLDDLARRLRSRIDEEWLEHGGFQDVVLVGHSIGGLIARRAYLFAAGAVPGEPGSTWGERVSRIVLFASVNRGINLDRIWWARPMAWLALALPLPHLRCEDALQGSDFLANLRIDWIRHFYALEAAEQQAPLVVQFLGDQDGVVSRDDSKDVLAFPKGHYIEVADATHKDLYRLDSAPDPTARYAKIRTAFLDDPVDIKSTDSAVRLKPSPAERIVFLLHGIRASNVDAWINGLETGLKARNTADTKIVHPTYGYFTAIRFALPSVRKKNIRFFQDAYTEELAQHPKAEFDIIAHSNGTYMLGHSLRRTPGMRFQNVVLAGSVLPTSYPWQDLMKREPTGSRQVSRILNERANRDWPVAILCGALQGLFMRDVGTGGFAGFEGGATSEIAYHDGGHGKALEPKNHNRLIAFVLGEEATRPSDLPDEPGYFRQLSNIAPYAAWLLLGGVLAWLAWLSFQGGVFNPQPVLYAFIGFLVLYVLLDVI